MGGGNRSTFIPNGTNLALNASDVPAPVNLTAANSTGTTGGALGGFARADLLVSVMGAVFAGALLV